MTSRITVIAPKNTINADTRLKGRINFAPFLRFLRKKNTRSSKNFITILSINAAQNQPITGVSIVSAADSSLNTFPIFSATVIITIMQKLINSIFFVRSFDNFIFNSVILIFQAPFYRLYHVSIGLYIVL